MISNSSGTKRPGANFDVPEKKNAREQKNEVRAICFLVQCEESDASTNVVVCEHEEIIAGDFDSLFGRVISVENSSHGYYPMPEWKATCRLLWSKYVTNDVKNQTTDDFSPIPTKACDSELWSKEAIRDACATFKDEEDWYVFSTPGAVKGFFPPCDIVWHVTVGWDNSDDERGEIEYVKEQQQQQQQQ